MIGKVFAQRNHMQMDMGMAMVMRMSVMRGMKCVNVLPVDRCCFDALR